MGELHWIEVLAETGLLEGKLVPVYPLGINIVLARFMGIVYALDGKCPHMACPLFSGNLEGSILTCPCHDWRFDIKTGAFITAPEIRIKVYPIRSESGQLFVGLP